MRINQGKQSREMIGGRVLNKQPRERECIGEDRSAEAQQCSETETRFSLAGMKGMGWGAVWQNEIFFFNRLRLFGCNKGSLLAQ